MALSEKNNSYQNQSQKVNKSWENFLDIFRERIGARQFQVFGSMLELTGINNGQVEMKTPQDFHRDWLLEKHRQAFEESFAQAFGPNKDYKIIVDNKSQKSISDPVSQPEPTSASQNEKSQNDKKVFPFAKKRQLNPSYTFENFVVGNSNNYAYSAAQAVAENPAEGYNPLFLHGDVGLGKTHLLQAIGHRVNDLWEQAAVKYVSAEKFTNEIIQAIQENNRKEFKYRYRNIDLLLVDDVQFFAQTERAQEEFFHTFNALYESGKGIALCSDRPPQEISLLEERLRNRFEMGFIVDIQPPDYETRVAILRNKADQAGIALSDEIIQTIAENVTNNVRALEGSLNQLTIMSSFSDEEITPNMIKSRLSSFMQAEQRLKTEVVTIDNIQKAVAEHFSVSIADLKSKKRTKVIALPRQIAMFLCRELTDSSYADIGEAFGGRDHSTVIHGENKISDELENDNLEIKSHLEKIKSLL